jgi:hypothetical protein
MTASFPSALQQALATAIGIQPDGVQQNLIAQVQHAAAQREAMLQQQAQQMESSAEPQVAHSGWVNQGVLPE